MNWLALLTATTWVDFLVVFIHKFLFKMTNSLDVWYSTFGMTAVTSDILIIVLGISLAKFLFPMATGWSLVSISVTIQMIHDILFYLGVIVPIPVGHNKVIDVFKRYSIEGSWRILVADALMVTGSVLGMEYLEGLPRDIVIFLGLLAVYSLTYIIYTK
jgi:hypothetical protein